MDNQQPPAPIRSAILAMDFTPVIVDFATDGISAVDNAAKVLDVGRDSAATIVHVLPGTIESLEANWPVGEPHPAVTPHEGDLIFAKSRIGAFSTTGLDVRLRCEGRDTLILMGIATSGVVLSTARAAYDLGYRVVVVEDACSDPDRSVHEALVSRVHPTAGSDCGVLPKSPPPQNYWKP